MFIMKLPSKQYHRHICEIRLFHFLFFETTIAGSSKGEPRDSSGWHSAQTHDMNMNIMKYNLLLNTSLCRPVGIHLSSRIFICQKSNNPRLVAEFSETLPHFSEQALGDSSGQDDLASGRKIVRGHCCGWSKAKLNGGWTMLTPDPKWDFGFSECSLLGGATRPWGWSGDPSKK